MGAMPPERIRLGVMDDRDRLRQARMFVRLQVESCGLGPEVVERAVQLAGEVLSHEVSHGQDVDEVTVAETGTGAARVALVVRHAEGARPLEDPLEDPLVAGLGDGEGERGELAAEGLALADGHELLLDELSSAWGEESAGPGRVVWFEVARR